MPKARTAIFLFAPLPQGKASLGKEPMILDFESASQWAHTANINRYRRLLGIRLGDNERQFIERLLNEEEEALMEAVRQFARLDCPTRPGVPAPATE